MNYKNTKHTSEYLYNIIVYSKITNRVQNTYTPIPIYNIGRILIQGQLFL